MRAAGLAIIAAGCGRFGFDGAPAVDSAFDDARPDAASICPGTTCTVASSETEYTVIQGADGWHYGYWWAELDGDGGYDAATDFRELAPMSGLWRPPDFQDAGPTFTWCYLAAWGGHPGDGPRKLPIRRWVSDVAGLAEVVVKHDKSDPTGGDGTRAVLVVDGVVLLSRAVAWDDAVGFTQAVPVELAIGSTVDLIIDPIGSDSVDSSDSTMSVRSG